MGRQVAAFDVDNTLTTRDCLIPFLAQLCGRRRLAASILSHPLALLAAFGRRDRLKALVVRAALIGRLARDVDNAGQSFATTVQNRWIRPGTLARLRWHQQRGDAVVLVSASLRAYVAPLGAALGVDAVLCTELEVGVDGRCTGELAGRNCRGREKARRLEQWRAETLGADEPFGPLWAYGDSAADRHLLAMADVATWVGRASLSAVPEVALP